MSTVYKNKVIANATPRIVSMSVSEYEALSEEEKNRDDVYYDIIDADDNFSPSGSSSTDIYSTEETRIGTWVDGKPLYRKTILGETPNLHNNPFLFADIGSQINLKHLFGVFYVSATDSVNPLPYMSSGGYLTVFQREKQYIYMNCSVESWLNAPCEITVEYTKTTDEEVSA